ncbi:MAG: cysteine hydrolase [Candidatus Bathyarchaeota archaeon]|nr:cysteine hydrolase [Candidatus Bathyarchaeota archaeon]
MANPAVILVDVQNDFVTGPLKTRRAPNVIEPLKRLVVAARLNSVPVIFSIDAHYPQDVEVVEKWGVHAIKGTEGAKVIAELAPQEDRDYIVEKRTYSGFYETGLDPLLRSLYGGDGVRTVILGGLHTNMCIRHTSADAFFRGYRIVVASDGVEAFTEKDHIEGLKYLEYVYNAKVMAVNEIIREIVRQPS